jgi:dUTP pyrophosphatase
VIAGAVAVVTATVARAAGTDSLGMSGIPRLRVQRLRSSATLPVRATGGAAGLDLCACLDQELVLIPGARALVPTGIAIALPAGHEGQVRPRSGLAAKHGVTVLNAPGTIDEDYRGEVKVILVNLGEGPLTIHHGDRIAQLIVAPVARLAVEEVGSLDATGRGDGGFGSTGRR